MNEQICFDFMNDMTTEQIAQKFGITEKEVEIVFGDFIQEEMDRAGV